jgi:hypothetical protein
MSTPIELPDETDAPPQGFEDAYDLARYAGDKFRLKAAARDYIRERQAELDAAEAEHARQLEEERAAHSKTRAQLRERIIDGALDRALVAAGAKAEVRPGALALLRKIWDFKIIDGNDGPVVAVTVGDAEQNISQAIEHWLSSDGGQAFSMRRPSTTAFDRIKQVTR